MRFVKKKYHQTQIKKIKGVLQLKILNVINHQNQMKKIQRRFIMKKYHQNQIKYSKAFHKEEISKSDKIFKGVL